MDKLSSADLARILAYVSFLPKFPRVCPRWYNVLKSNAWKAEVCPRLKENKDKIQWGKLTQLFYPLQNHVIYPRWMYDVFDLPNEEYFYPFYDICRPENDTQWYAFSIKEGQPSFQVIQKKKLRTEHFFMEQFDNYEVHLHTFRLPCSLILLASFGGLFWILECRASSKSGLICHETRLQSLPCPVKELIYLDFVNDVLLLVSRKYDQYIYLWDSALDAFRLVTETYSEINNLHCPPRLVIREHDPESEQDYQVYLIQSLHENEFSCTQINVHGLGLKEFYPTVKKCKRWCIGVDGAFLVQMDKGVFTLE